MKKTEEINENDILIIISKEDAKEFVRIYLDQLRSKNKIDLRITSKIRDWSQ